MGTVMRISRQCAVAAMAVVVVTIMGPQSAARAATLSIEPVTALSGQSLAVPVLIAPVEQLAGVKIVLRYDPRRLAYEKAETSETTAGWMRVINDKTPGKLVIVMAGAKGIHADSLALIRLYFKAAPGLKEKTTVRIQAVEMEMVSEAIRPIPCRFSGGDITLLPERN